MGENVSFPFPQKCETHGRCLLVIVIVTGLGENNIFSAGPPLYLWAFSQSQNWRARPVNLKMKY